MDCENKRCRGIGTHSGADENKACEEVERDRHEIGVAFGSEGERSTVHAGESRCAWILRYR